MGKCIGFTAGAGIGISEKSMLRFRFAYRHARLLAVITILLLGTASNCAAESISSELSYRTRSFNNSWKFTTEDVYYAYYNSTDDSQWQDVTLPHIPRIEPLVVNDQWQGRCWYRKHFSIPDSDKGKKIFLRFEGAMQLTQIWINEKTKSTHQGGYLPFVIDITDDIVFDRENIISIRLDNSSNPGIPPGKQLEVLDFCYYGGLYRDVSLVVTDKLHITDAIFAEKTAGGGVFARTLYASKDLALVQVKTHVINEYKNSRSCKLRTTLLNKKERYSCSKNKP